MRHRKFELAILLAFLLVGLICIIQTRPKYKNAETNMMQSNVNPSYDGFKAEVGRAAWKFLHTLGSKFPQNPTLEEKERYLGFILEFSKLYPCQECREDFQKILKGSPPQENLNSTVVFYKKDGQIVVARKKKLQGMENRLPMVSHLSNKLQTLSAQRLASCRQNEEFLKSYIEKKSDVAPQTQKESKKNSDEPKIYYHTSLQNMENICTEVLPSSNCSDVFSDYGSRAWHQYQKSISLLGGSKFSSIKDLASYNERNRKRLSKRRRYDDTQDISFINLRNQKFNEKLGRAYEIFTQNIKDKLEQG